MTGTEVKKVNHKELMRGSFSFLLEMERCGPHMQRWSCPSDTIVRQFLRQANHPLWLRSHECSVDVKTLQKA